MESVIAALGKQITTRWFTLLALPGVAYVAVCILAWKIGPKGAGHALDVNLIVQLLGEAGHWSSGNLARRTLIVIAALLVALVVSISINKASRLMERLWLGRGHWSRVFTRRLTERRKRRQEAGAPPGSTVPATYLASRATWIGDRFQLVDRRIQAQYGLPLVRLWPPLWQLCSHDDQRITQTAWHSYAASVVWATWALAYMIVGLYWWPAAIAGVAILLFAWDQGRRSAEEFCTAVEALVDVKIVSVATALGIFLPTGRVTQVEGYAIDNILAKGNYIST
ncbi:hypothetical protein OG948_34165 (plasmid) [Embleya sp. NBC_00888]|uniref:hypothetical protein n=1 Tax=Embleya sp. NBC_00888 TaxID=2975960 RepID=UPI002F917CB7|nr:hypothetical protein OG948_34165 [Embleya sp. NBC_00888]